MKGLIRFVPIALALLAYPKPESAEGQVRFAALKKAVFVTARVIPCQQRSLWEIFRGKAKRLSEHQNINTLTLY